MVDDKLVGDEWFPYFLKTQAHLTHRKVSFVSHISNPDFDCDFARILEVKERLEDALMEHCLVEETQESNLLGGTSFSLSQT